MGWDAVDGRHGVLLPDSVVLGALCILSSLPSKDLTEHLEAEAHLVDIQLFCPYLCLRRRVFVSIRKRGHHAVVSLPQHLTKGPHLKEVIHTRGTQACGFIQDALILERGTGRSLRRWCITCSPGWRRSSLGGP